MEDKNRTIIWVIYCPSPTVRREAETLARAEIGSPRISTTRTFPGGVEMKKETRRDPRDYFDDIHIEGRDDQESFELVFSPRQDADRYWKDLMVQILQSIRSGVDGISVKPAR